MMSFLTSFVGAAAFGTVIFGSRDNGPLFGAEAALGVVVAPVLPVDAGIVAGFVGGGFSVCAADGAGMMCAVSALAVDPAVFFAWVVVEPHAARASAAASVVNGSSRERINARRLPKTPACCVE